VPEVAYLVAGYLERVQQAAALAGAAAANTLRRGRL